MQGTNRTWVGGEKSLLCDPGSELRLGGRENRRATIINRMEKNWKKTTKKMIALALALAAAAAAAATQQSVVVFVVVA